MNAACGSPSTSRGFAAAALPCRVVAQKQVEDDDGYEVRGRYPPIAGLALGDDQSLTAGHIGKHIRVANAEGEPAGWKREVPRPCSLNGLEQKRAGLKPARLAAVTAMFCPFGIDNDDESAATPEG